MLRSQRILIATGLLVIAWILHVNMCEWVFNSSVQLYSFNGVPVFTPICVWIRQPPPSSPATVVAAPGPMQPPSPPPRPVYTGVLTQAYVGRTEAVVIGIVLPLLLVMLVAYLSLGWRRDVRSMRGLCATCGYDLRGVAVGADASTTKCPECGTSSSSATLK